MNVVPLTKELQRYTNDFKCGNYYIDNFLKSVDALDPALGITYVMFVGSEIVGFYNICTGRVDRVEQISNSYYYYPMGGSVHINYFAVHEKYQRRILDEEKSFYLSDFLLGDCEKRIRSIRNTVGFSFIALYSTERGYHFYHERNEYEDFEEDMSTFQNESDFQCLKLYKCIENAQG